jgi:hypothetical protein
MHVGLVPEPAQDRAPLLEEYVRVASSRRKHFPLPVGAPLADFAAIAPQYPVYRIEAPPAACCATSLIQHRKSRAPCSLTPQTLRQPERLIESCGDCKLKASRFLPITWLDIGHKAPLSLRNVRKRFGSEIQPMSRLQLRKTHDLETATPGRTPIT